MFTKFKNGPLRFSLAAVILVGGVTTGCNAENKSNADNNQPQASSEMQSWLSDLDPQQSTLSITGAVTSTGEYTTSEDQRYTGVSYDVFRPARGGGQSRRGRNADGPYSFTVYIDAIHEDEPDDVVRAWVSLVLPVDAQPGQIYSIASFADAGDNQVQAHVQGAGMSWRFSRKVSGELYLYETGEQGSAAWQLRAADSNGDQARWVAAEGAVKALPLTHQAEAEYAFSVNGEHEDSLNRISGRVSGDTEMLSIGNGIYLYIPIGIEAGTYPIQTDQSDTAIRAQFTRHDVDNASGELVLTSNDDHYDAVFTLDGAGEDTLSLVGDLRRFEIGSD